MFQGEADEPELSDGDVTWTQIARTYRKHLRPKKRRSKGRPIAKDVEGQDSSSSESDDDWSTESETEKESEGGMRIYK